MISEEVITQIREAMDDDIKDIIGATVTLKKEGKEFAGLCPFHNEKSPSFKVNQVKRIYKCFGCGRFGNAISFVMETQHLNFMDAIQWGAKKYSITIEDHAVRAYVKPLARLEKLSTKALNWFEKERRISNNTLLRFGITESLEYMTKFKDKVLVICFNYVRNETLINIKFRGPQKSFQLAKDAELIFYNLDAIKDERKCIIVEGEMDCLALYEAGIFNVVSVPNGAGTGNLRLEYLDNCWEYFMHMEEIILAVDNDAPGIKLREELARRLGSDKCKQVTYPEGCKDANDVLIKYDTETVKKVIADAAEWPLFGLVPWEEMEKEVDEYYEEGYPEGCRTHIPGFDELLTFYPGQLTTVTGAPGSGKSEFVDLIMTSLSTFHDWSWGICSFETKPAFHVTKLAEKFAKKAFNKRSDPNYRMTRREFEFAKAKIKKHFHFINLTLIDVTMEGLLKKAEELVVRKGINGLLFDPWNCIEHKYDNNETKYILSCLNHMLQFLDKYQVHGILVAHPTKMQKDRKTKEYPVPTMYDIAGSAHFYNRTFNGFSVVRSYVTGVVDVYVQKVKYAWLGKIGYCTFAYNIKTRQYDVLPEAEAEDIPKKGKKSNAEIVAGPQWQPVPIGDLFASTPPEENKNQD